MQNTRSNRMDYGAEFQTLKQDNLGHNDSENRLARGHEFVQDSHLHAPPHLEHLMPVLEVTKAQLQTQVTACEPPPC